MSSPYLDALKMLARRELSEAEVRQRLGRHGHDSDAIDEAIGRLKEERSIDDRRVAEAIARTQTAVKGRGRLRVRQRLASAGIGAADSKRAIEEVFAELDDDSLIEAAISKRLRERMTLGSDAEFRRLYRYLIGQGFEHDHIMRALTARRMTKS